MAPLWLMVILDGVRKFWKHILGFGVFISLKNRFRTLYNPIQFIILIILALVPAGLLSVMVYSKYISYLRNTDILQGPVKCFVAILIVLFGLIIFIALFLIIHKVLKGKWLGERLKETGISIGRALKRFTKFTFRVIKKGTISIGKVSIKIVKTSGRKIKNGAFFTGKKVSQIDSKFRRKDKVKK